MDLIEQMEHHTTATINEETFWEVCVTQYISLPRLSCHIALPHDRDDYSDGIEPDKAGAGASTCMCNVHSVTSQHKHYKKNHELLAYC